MMGKLSDFERSYNINDFCIRIKGKIKQTDWGRYIAEVEYPHPDGTKRKGTIFLGDESKSKLEKKLIRFLYSELYYDK